MNIRPLALRKPRRWKLTNTTWRLREDFDGEIIYCFLEAAPHEMVPGTWTFRVLMDGKAVAEKSFQVVK